MSHDVQCGATGDRPRFSRSTVQSQYSKSTTRDDRVALSPSQPHRLSLTMASPKITLHHLNASRSNRICKRTRLSRPLTSRPPTHPKSSGKHRGRTGTSVTPKPSLTPPPSLGARGAGARVRCQSVLAIAELEGAAAARRGVAVWQGGCGAGVGILVVVVLGILG
jgi:hypothetical protein